MYILKRGDFPDSDDRSALITSALAMVFMLFAGYLLNPIGITPNKPIIFSFITPVLIMMQLGFLF